MTFLEAGLEASQGDQPGRATNESGWSKVVAFGEAQCQGNAPSLPGAIGLLQNANAPPVGPVGRALGSLVCSLWGGSTDAGRLSSRIPTKVGCRSFPPLVHSTKPTWQTSLGSPKTHSFILSAVRASPRRLPPFGSGRLAKGHEGVRRASSFGKSSRRVCSTNPWSFHMANVVLARF